MSLSMNLAKFYDVQHIKIIWRSAQLHSVKPELRFWKGANPSRPCQRFSIGWSNDWSLSSINYFTKIIIMTYCWTVEFSPKRLIQAVRSNHSCGSLAILLIEGLESALNRQPIRGFKQGKKARSMPNACRFCLCIERKCQVIALFTCARFNIPPKSTRFCQLLFHCKNVKVICFNERCWIHTIDFAATWDLLWSESP